MVYAGFVYLTVKVITGTQGSQSRQQQDVTAQAMQHPAGRWLVGIAGVIVAIIGLVFVHWFALPSLALVVGGACGVLNLLLTMRFGERVVESRKVGAFVLSSFLRIAVFGIVPVAFAAVGPWWSMAWYFAGFFLPLALYAATVGHTLRRE